MLTTEPLKEYNMCKVKKVHTIAKTVLVKVHTIAKTVFVKVHTIAKTVFVSSCLNNSLIT